MVALKRLFFVAMVTLYLQPTLETSTRQTYNNVMMSSLRNLNSYRKSLAHKWNNKASRRSPYKPPTKIDLMKKHMKTHQYDGHVPNPNWHIQIHRGIEPAKNKIETMAKSYWYSFGNHRWTGHVPYPYYHPEIQKGVEITGRKVSKVLRDYWLDLSHDKWRYGIKQAIGVISGIVGYYTRTSAFGIISGPLFGYLMASVEHYIERRLYYEDYKNRSKEERKREHARLMHPNIDLSTTKKPFTSDESYENE